MVRGEIPRRSNHEISPMKQAPLFAGMLAEPTSAADSRAAQPERACS